MSTSTDEPKDRLLHLLGEGNLTEARPLCEAWLARSDSADAWRILGVIIGREGKLPEAERCFREAVARDPADTKAFSNLAHILRAQGNPAGAASAFRSALTLKDDAGLRFALADVLTDLGDLPAAEVEFRNGLAAEPENIPARYSLGWVCQRQGLFKEARDCYEQVLARDPDHAQAMNNLGVLLLDADALSSGVEEIAHGVVGLAQPAQHHPSDAEAAFRAALRLQPDFVEAHNNLGTALRVLNRLAEAEAAYREALRLKPDYTDALVNLGVVLHMQNRGGEAIASLMRALQIDPRSAEAHNNLGNIYALAGRLTEAIASYREALRRKPDSAETYNNLFNTHLRRGEVDEALHCWREACRLDPGHAAATYSAYLFSLNYHPEWTPEAIFEEHRRWGEVYAPQPREPPAHGNSAEPERRLRVGYVSADFREHPVAFFMEPVLAHHDRAQFDIYCYAQVAAPDGATARLKQLVPNWRSIVGLDDRQVAGLIHSDEIDILIDLTGHTAGNRLGVFAHRPAPVQATYIGYPDTTGLPAMDYRITNPLTTPPEIDRHYTETVVRLPYPYCIRLPADCPPVNTPPALANGRVTFGCFNNLAKLAPPVIALWSAILQAVPGSRLLLKSQPFKDPGTRALFLDRFAAHGIDPERLVLRGADSFRDYLRSFNDIDIALDPFPYNGGTTTYHALWMGVPVVALEGKSYVSRMGYGVLATLGLEELTAKTPEDYVRIATGLATDPGRLQTLRASLRARMAASPLTDGERYTAALEKVYRDMWRNWCEQGHNG